MSNLPTMGRPEGPEGLELLAGWEEEAEEGWGELVGAPFPARRSRGVGGEGVDFQVRHQEGGAPTQELVEEGGRTELAEPPQTEVGREEVARLPERLAKVDRATWWEEMGEGQTAERVARPTILHRTEVQMVGKGVEVGARDNFRCKKEGMEEITGVVEEGRVGRLLEADRADPPAVLAGSLAEEGEEEEPAPAGIWMGLAAGLVAFLQEAEEGEGEGGSFG